jgi:hypothetical protein
VANLQDLGWLWRENLVRIIYKCSIGVVKRKDEGGRMRDEG